MTIEDQNPDRLCIPEYHKGETLRLVMEARRTCDGANAAIKAHEKKLVNEHIPNKEKRELELKEWMRRDGLKDAIYPWNKTSVIRAHINPYDTLTLTVMPVQNI